MPQAEQTYAFENARVVQRERLRALETLLDSGTIRHLESLGVELDPWDGRMALGRPIPRRESTIYGSVVGALG